LKPPWQLEQGGYVAGEFTVKIEGLKEFRKALKDAADANPRELTRALKEAGTILPPKIRVNAPRKTGALAASVGNVSATGTKGRVPVRAKYAAPVEFSKRGAAAQTLTSKYGSPPRYAYKAVEDSSEQVIERIYDGLEQIVTAHGWFK
jgi:hypothetical protein